jgi:hypothetical protein
MSDITVKINNICNFSKFPMSLYDNPLIDIAQSIMANKEIAFAPKTFEDINLSKFYRVDVSSLKDYNSDCLFLPWIHSKPVTKYRDFFFNIFCKKQYFKTEIDKIRFLIDSISTHGYCPERFNNRQGGQITGYFLEHLGKKVFYVVSGNHRVSVLKSLGVKKITANYSSIEHLKDRDLNEVDVKFLGNHIYSTKNISSWPCVQSGFLTKEDTLCIIKTYFNEVS